MRKFLVHVNGTAYEIMVEEITGAAAAPAAAPAAPVAPAAPAAGAQSITAPMPGTILAVNVQAGSVVKKGQMLMVLEAMKMENEILAPTDGVVNSVNAAKGATVNSGDVLLVLG